MFLPSSGKALVNTSVNFDLSDIQTKFWLNTNKRRILTQDLTNQDFWISHTLPATITPKTITIEAKQLNSACNNVI